MNTIDADAAKLAGLQIDQLQKLRQGHRTLADIKWFNDLKREDLSDLQSGRKRIMVPPTPPEPTGSLEWVHSLGMLTVPMNYVAEKRLEAFRPTYEKNAALFHHWPHDLTDKKHARASIKIKAGQVFNVDAYMWFGPDTDLSVCLGIIASMRGTFLLGSYGASLVLEHMHSVLIKDRPYVSLDEERSLAFCEGTFWGGGAPYIIVDGYDGKWKFGFYPFNARMDSRMQLILRFSDPRS